MLGFISGENARDEHAPTEKELSAFYVDPDYQRQGIGTKLFNAFRQEITNSSFYLRTLSGCKGEQFYKKHG
ncbi:MAG: GNAT family N-acetyltransferase [Candidatus Peribacteria bacterium]|nr:GNAT family N-acetyltransferase [Candidatus Peribacteria bacterium]